MGCQEQTLLLRWILFGEKGYRLLDKPIKPKNIIKARDVIFLENQRYKDVIQERKPATETNVVQIHTAEDIIHDNELPEDENQALEPEVITSRERNKKSNQNERNRNLSS